MGSIPSHWSLSHKQRWVKSLFGSRDERQDAECSKIFYFHLFFVSIFGGCVPPDTATPVVKCCIVLCATFLHWVPMVTVHRVRLGTDSLAGEPECWWFSYWLVREKSLSHFFCFVHRTESFPTLSVQTLGLHTDGAGAMGSVINEIDWISHQTLSSPCRITDRSKSEHLHLDQLPSQVFLALISEESSVGWEEWRHSESDAPRFEDDSDVEG